MNSKGGNVFSALPISYRHLVNKKIDRTLVELEERSKAWKSAFANEISKRDAGPRPDILLTLEELRKALQLRVDEFYKVLESTPTYIGHIKPNLEKGKNEVEQSPNP